MCSPLPLPLLVAVLLIACSPCVLSGGANFGTRTSSSLSALYTFEEGQLNPSATKAGDVRQGGRIIGNLSLELPETEWIAGSTGVRFSRTTGTRRVVSDGTLTSFYTAADANGGLTVEMWFRYSITTQTAAVPLGLGAFPGPEFELQSCESSAGSLSPERFDYQMVLGDEFLVHQFRDQSNGCADSPVAVVDNTLQHIVMTLDLAGDPVSTRIYRNGGLAAFASIGVGVNVTTDWGTSAAGSRLELAPMNEIGAANNLFKGDVLLVALYSRALTAGEVQTNYDAGLPNSLAVGTTSAVSVAEDEADVFKLAATDVDDDPMTIEVVSVPTKGMLYEYRGDEATRELRFYNITAPELPFTLRSNWSLAYQGELHEHGTDYSSFTYRVHDGVGWSRIFTVSITVAPQQDPPVPTSGAQRVVRLVNSTVTLSGTDVDASDTIDGAIIQTLPTKGDLFRTTDGTTPGAVLLQTDLPYTITNGLRQVIYSADHVSASQSGLEVVGTDEFNFTVVDSTGLESVSHGTVVIEIENNVQGIEQQLEAVEDTVLVLTLQGQDLAQPSAELLIFITSLPTYGNLSFVNETAVILAASQGSPVQVPVEDSGMLWYRPALDVSDVFDSFTYYVQVGSWRSAPAEQRMYLKPVNDAPRLRLLTESLTTVANTENLLLLDLRMTDGDMHDHDFLCTVTVDAFDAALSLNPSVVERGTLHFRIGDGLSDFQTLFSGSQQDVADALVGMEFAAALKGSKLVQIEVSDEDPDNPQSSSIAFLIDVKEDPNATTDTNALLDLEYMLVLWALVIFCPLCLCCFCCMRKYVEYQVGKKVRSRKQMPFCLRCVAYKWTAEVKKRKRRKRRTRKHRMEMAQRQGHGHAHGPPLQQFHSTNMQTSPHAQQQPYQSTSMPMAPQRPRPQQVRAPAPMQTGSAQPVPYQYQTSHAGYSDSD